MDYEKKFLIGDYVKGKRTSNGEVIEGKFNGFHLYNKLNPKSVVGVIDTDERCYDVSVDSIELVESEDEKIRKWILSYFKGWLNTDCPSELQEEVESVLAWLEKQGHDGKKWIYEDVYLKEKEQLIQDGIDEVLENPQKYGLEKQGEQNTTNNQFTSEQASVLDKHIDKFLEHKSSWSEEDEKCLVDATNFLYRAKNEYAQTARLEECIDWLKSLKPQKHWKPSEEQMEIIDMILTNESMDDNVARIMRELKEQLEKL